jgi:hypothetical protein
MPTAQAALFIRALMVRPTAFPGKAGCGDKFLEKTGFKK